MVSWSGICRLRKSSLDVVDSLFLPVCCYVAGRGQCEDLLCWLLGVGNISHGELARPRTLRIIHCGNAGTYERTVCVRAWR